MNRGALGYPRGFPPGSFSWPFGRRHADFFDQAQAVGHGDGAGANYFTNAVSAAGANTKGTYVEFTSATPYDSYMFRFTATNLAAGRDYLVDIALGPAGSEVVLIPDMFIGAGAVGCAYATVEVPVYIPGGSRVSLRTACTTGSSTFGGHLHLHRGEYLGAMKAYSAVNYGATAADSGGIQVDPGGSVNAFGSWTELAAQTTERHSSFIVCAGRGTNTTNANSHAEIEIGMGPGTTALTSLISGVIMTASTVTDSFGPSWYWFPVPIPAGVRLAARSRCTTIDATDRLFDVLVIGLGP